MKLSLSSGEEVVNPADDAIRAALQALDVQRDGEGFAILGVTEMTYVQVSGDAARGFDLEYQDGAVAQHYRALRQDYTLDEIVAVFADYRDGTIDWSQYGEFEKISW
jgi:hypothetical protein